MSMYPIATQTVGSGGATSVTFIGIPQNFTHLQFRVFARSQASAAVYYSQLNFNGDNGNNYSWHFLNAGGASVGGGNSTNVGGAIGVNMPAATESANIFAVGIYDILDYSNTTKNKVVKCFEGHDSNNSNGEVFIISSAWYNTAAIISLNFSASGSSFAPGSRFDLYGISTASATGA